MLIDQIDFSALYQQQLAQAGRHKTAEQWDKRAKHMASRATRPDDAYLQQLIRAIDLTGARTLLDVGCGPGTVCLPLARQLEQVYGIDYSPGMLAVARERAQALQLHNVSLQHCAWEDDWSTLPRCDIVVASRSTLVADLRQALGKLNQQARLQVYTTHPLRPCFVDPAIQQAIGREVTELPNYLYAVNILYQMGIHARVDFIRPAPNPPAPDFDSFADSINWSLGGITDDERQRLFDYYQSQRHQHALISPHSRDWALIAWQPQPSEPTT